MDISDETMRSARSLTRFAGDAAPVEVLAALVALVDPNDVVAAVAQSHEADNGTQWCVVWATNDRIAYALARAESRAWNLSVSPHVKASEVSASV